MIMSKEDLIKNMKTQVQLTELERIKISKDKLMFLKNQNNLGDIIFINAVLDKYEKIIELINGK